MDRNTAISEIAVILTDNPGALDYLAGLADMRKADKEAAHEQQ